MALRFAEVAKLLNVCWLEVTGSWLCSLSPGTYTLSWRLSINYGRHSFQGFRNSPVKFYFEASGNVPVQYEKDLTTIEIRQRNPVWVEVDVGEFTVESSSAPVELKFSMMQVTGARWKRGIFLDGVVIQPSRNSRGRRIHSSTSETTDYDMDGIWKRIVGLNRK